jgi:hypothetical protein
MARTPQARQASTPSEPASARRPRRVASVPPAGVVRAATGFVDSLQALQRNIQPPFAILSNYVAGAYLTSRVVCAVAELGVADELSKGPASVATLADSVRADASALARLLRAAASLGIFEELEPGTFKTNSLGQYLETGRPGSMRAWARYVGAPWNQEVWSHFLESVQTGHDVYSIRHGHQFFEHFANHPEQGGVFDAAMTGLSALSDDPIAAAYPFGKCGTVVDVAGGLGGQLAAILARHPKIRGVLFDQTSVIERATPLWQNERADLVDRAAFQAGDFFEGVPQGMDLYLLKSIIHDWEDGKAQKILRRCAEAMPKGGRLLLAELVIPPGNGAHFGKLLDIAMLALTGGRERTALEYAALFEASGLKLERTVATASPYSLLVASKRE